MKRPLCEGIAYPAARRSAKIDHFHGVAIEDPYDWLGEPTVETQGWIDVQAELAATVFARLEVTSRVERILRELKASGTGEASFSRGGFRFAFEPDEDGRFVLVRTAKDGTVARFAPRSIEAVRQLRLQPEFVYVSPSGRYLAAGLCEAGTDWSSVHLWDFDRNVLVPTSFPETVHPVVTWMSDDSAFYYNVTRSQFGRDGVRDGVYRHRLDATADDGLVFDHVGLEGHAALPIVVEGAGVLLVKTFDFVTQKAGLFACAWDSGAAPRRLLAFGAALNVLGELAGEIFLETNLDAPNGRIVAVDPRAGAIREIVPEKVNAYLAIAKHATRATLSTLAHGRLIATYIRDASHTISTFDLDGRPLADAPLPAYCTIGRVSDTDDGIEIVLSTFAATRRRFILGEDGGLTEPVPSVELLPPHHIERIWSTSADGTRVPAFVITPADRDKALPTLLYGYGGWGQSTTPSYHTDLAAWLRLGGAYVVAILRGGGEFGEAWHDAGARRNKANGFDDFCAVAEMLIRNGITTPEQLAIRGLSNGGLLVTACTNRRPELFAAASASVPLVDVVHLMELSAGAAISRELGDPVADAEAFAVMRSYSPLQNIAASPERPALLVTIAERDERVPREWAFRYVAAMQASALPGQCVVMDLVKGEGHVGWPEETVQRMLANELAFLWSVVGSETIVHD